MPAFNALSARATPEQVIAVLNGALAALNGPTALPTYTVATRPAVAAWTGTLIYVSDAAAGSKLQYSDGAAWVAAG